MKKHNSTHPTPSQIPVAERSVVSRVNRKLREQHEQLHSIRPKSRLREIFGAYYVTDGTANIKSANIDLESFAREIGALAPHECLAP